MKIESVSMDCIDEAVRIYKDSFLECGYDVSDSACEEYIFRHIPGMYLISDDNPVGIFYFFDGEIAGLYIRKSFRRKGYGSSCIKFAQEKCSQLKLIAMHTNIAAINMYEKMGFSFSGDDSQIKVGYWTKELLKR